MMHLIWFELVKTFTRRRTYIGFLAFGVIVPLVLVVTILVDSVRVWVGLLRGSRAADLREAPFVASRLRAEEL